MVPEANFASEPDGCRKNRANVSGGCLPLPGNALGVVVISGKDLVQHQGLSLTVEGTVNLQLSAKSVSTRLL